jgi:signal transduction histidine kinase
VENARLYHRAQEAIDLRDDFLAVASHELKTPLTTLQLQLDSLEATIERACAREEKAARRMASVTRQMQRLTRLVESLLDVSRLTTGRLALNREVFDLRGLVRSVLGHLEAQARSSGTELSAHLPEDAVVGSWDRLRIEQVLANIVSNALKYGPGKPVQVSLEVDGALARLSVKDEGIGISPQDARRIFDRFERAVPTQNYGGMGLGLFITRQIVEAHGGDIRVHSRPGEGAEFIVQLPTLLPAEETTMEELR